MRNTQRKERRESLDCLTRSPTRLKRKNGDVSFPSLRVFMIWVGRESILNVWLIKVCVCLCAPPTPCREGCIHCCRRDKKKKRQFRALLGVVIQLVTQNMWLSRCMPICFCSWWTFYPRENLHKYVAKLSDEILHFECNSFCVLH